MRPTHPPRAGARQRRYVAVYMERDVKKHKRSLLGDISDQAMATYDTSKGYGDEWVDHWFFVAYEFREKFLQEGLSKTADAISQIIAEQKAIVGRATT